MKSQGLATGSELAALVTAPAGWTDDRPAEDDPEVDLRCVSEGLPHLIGSLSKSSWLKVLKMSFPPTLPFNTIQRDQLVLKKTRR